MVRQGAPSTAGQITAEAWSAMGEAAHRAGMPLDQWLKAQLLGTLPASVPASPDAAPSAPASGSLTDLQRRMQELAGDIDRLSVPPVAAAPSYAPAQPEAPQLSQAALSQPQLSPAEAKLDSAIRQINDKLEEMTLGRPRSAQPARNADMFGERVNDILRTAETMARREPAVPQPASYAASSPSSIEAAVAEIAARQHQLEASPAVAAPLAPRTPPAAAPQAVEEDSRSTEALGSLRGDLGDMKRAIGGLAPRRSVDELQRTVVRLAERVERSGAADEELRATLVALRDMIGALRLPEHPAVMQGRIEALSRKIDIVNAKTVDGASIARLQAQASEIRDLLGRALSNDTVRLLAEQVALMASKISQISGVDEAMIRSAISPLERRIDKLSERIVPPVAIPVDDIFRRLDDIQLSLAAARREAPANMEGLFKGLSDRIERIERPAPDSGISGQQFDALTRQIAALAERIENAQAPVAQLAGIERTLNDLFIQMEETRATVLANAGHRPRPPAGPAPSTDAAMHRGVNLLKREIAVIEAARAAAPPETAPVAAAPVAAAPVAAAPKPAPAAPAPAYVPEPAPAPVVATTAPVPASIPKPFEPQLMRAALEELARSPEMAAPFQSPVPPRARPEIEEAVDLDEVARLAGALGDDFDVLAQIDKSRDPASPPAAGANDAQAAPMAANGGPGRVEFIAQARRATQPASVVLPPMHSRVGERSQRKPTRWLARIRATLLIGMCGSAMAYGSWHLLGALREAQLQAAAPAPAAVLAAPARTMTPPAATPAPEDITGSVGVPAQMRLSPPSDLPPAPQAMPPASLGPSSMSLPSDIPGSIGSQGLRSSALAGDPAAAYEIAHRYMEGIGVPVSATRAAEWFEFAAGHGSVPAAYRLGSIYEKGMDGVPRDVARARKLYEQAAAAGNVRAMHNLGVLLAAGVDGQPDYREAVVWFNRAAERGVRDSQYNLAVLYARGFGVAVNLGQAWQWFSLAAARGDTEAAVKRDEIAAKMDAKTLAAAQSAVATWAPMMVDAKANSGSGSQDWNQADSQLPRKTASR